MRGEIEFDFLSVRISKKKKSRAGRYPLINRDRSIPSPRTNCDYDLTPPEVIAGTLSLLSLQALGRRIAPNSELQQDRGQSVSARGGGGGLFVGPSTGESRPAC